MLTVKYLRICLSLFYRLTRWELLVLDKQNPQICEIIDFLRSHQLQGSATSCNSTKNHNKPFKPNSYKSQYGTKQNVLSATSSLALIVCCPLCKRSDYIRNCQLFNDQIPSERFKMTKTHQLCNTSSLSTRRQQTSRVVLLSTIFMIG